MRRAAPISLALAVAGVAAGCGAEGVVSPTPVKVVGTVPKAAAVPATPAFKLKGNSAAGAKIYVSSGCGSCHTLAAAHSNGTVGPNLDTLKPDYLHVTAQVTNGGAIMPPFKGRLSPQQIADVSAYVVRSTGGTP